MLDLGLSKPRGVKLTLKPYELSIEESRATFEIHPVVHLSMILAAFLYVELGLSLQQN